MNFKTSLITTLVSLGLLVGACTSGEQATTSGSPTANSPEPAAAPPSAPPETTTQADPTHDTSVSQGGQVLETGPYHLELVTLKEAGGVHLDFYLQEGDTHAAIPNAKVTGQVQLPNGTQKAVKFEYDTAGKHYAAVLPETMAGDYKVAILTDIKGEKVNGRFNFKQ